MIAKQKPRSASNQQSRKQYKKNKNASLSKRKQEKEADATTRKEKRGKRKRRSTRRIFPIWLRLIIFSLLCTGALIIGLIIGYAILGDGSPKDILKIDAWQHIIDIVKKDK